MLSWGLIITFVLLVALAAFWQSGLSVRERANHAAQDACARMGVQFLDGTVAFSRLGLTRNETGRLTLRRTYVFDYTAASIERRQGFVVMLGQRLEHIGFERDGQRPTHVLAEHDSSNFDGDFGGSAGGRSSVQPTAHGADPHAPPATHSANGKVLQLEEWRRRRAQPGNKPPPPPRHDQSDNGW